MIVNVNGVKHEVATLAEARALSGVAAGATQSVVTRAATTWGDESDGNCNRCGGHGTWGNRNRGGACFRCTGTGVAPGFKGLAIAQGRTILAPQGDPVDFEEVHIGPVYGPYHAKAGQPITRERDAFCQPMD